MRVQRRERFEELQLDAAHEVFAGRVVAQREAEQVEDRAAGVCHAAPLNLEFAEAELVQATDFVEREGGAPVVRVAHEPAHVRTAVVREKLVELRVLRAEIIQRRIGQRTVVQVADAAVAHAVFVDENLVARLVLELFEQVEVPRVVGVDHHLVVAFGEAAVVVELAAPVLDGDLDDGGDRAQRRVVLLHVLVKRVRRHDDAVPAGGIVALEEFQNRVAGLVGEMLFRQQVVGEREVHGDAAARVGEPGVADLLRRADELGQHAPAVPQAKRRAVDERGNAHAEDLAEEVVKEQQLPIVRERARNVPFGVGPKRIQNGGGASGLRGLRHDAL